MKISSTALVVVVGFSALTHGGVAAAAPPLPPPFTPTLLLRQLPSGEVLLLDPQGMRLSRWAVAVATASG